MTSQISLTRTRENRTKGETPKALILSSIFLLSLCFISFTSASTSQFAYNYLIQPLTEVNSTFYWGNYSSPSQIIHSLLSGLGWSVAGHYIDTNLNMNNYSIVNADWINSTYVNASTGWFNDVYVANSSLYIGPDIILSAGGLNGTVLNISGGNVSASYYYGSGKFLTDINLTGISFVGGDVNASRFYGWFNWTSISPYLSFDGYNLNFNESLMNSTIQQLAEVQIYYEIVNMTTSGGNAYATVPSLIDFEIKQITVVPTTANTNYRFEAVEFTSGDYIDKDRMVHVGTWDIAKNYAINGMINLSVTSASNDELFTVTIKYLDNFRNL